MKVKGPIRLCVLALDLQYIPRTVTFMKGTLL